ncbi:MAG: hypothetical protein HY960_04130 [Ignavibacteriae bacterium]|nr:hypothetical protein [Ignavibacteriota bacterium]
MNKTFINKVTMYSVVHQLLVDNPTITALIKAFANAIILLGENILLLGGKEQERTSAAKGKSAVKENVEATLKDTVISISSAIFSYAADIKDAELKVKSKVTKTALDKIRDNDLITLAKNIRELAITHSVALADYDITAQDITDFDSLINSYGTAKVNIGTGISQRKSVGQTQKEIITETDALLKERLDKYVERLKKKHPDFYRQYKAARVIRDIGGTGPKTPPPPTP